ncbi:MAG: hypothetical protein V1809_01250 [Planctomycetota bacterium]
MILRPFHAFFFIAGVLAAGGCSLAARDDRSRTLYTQGRFAEAATVLDPKVGPDTKGKDRLLFLMNRGMMLHAAGRYAESNACLLPAADEADKLDIIRISEQAGTILTNEKFSAYRGEDFERVLIPTLAAINYAMLGKNEDALVECRRIDIKLREYARKRGTDYRQNAFAVYLSGVLYEIMGGANDAYVDYKKVRELDKNFPQVKADLLRLAAGLNFTDELDQWKKEFKADPPAPAPGGEILCLIELGLAPVKKPNEVVFIIPRFVSRPTRARAAEILVKGESKGRSWPLADLDAMAKKSLDERVGKILAKRLAIIAAKEVAAHQIEDHAGKDWALLSRIVFYALEQPDLRSWQTLPRDLQVARVSLPVGTYSVAVRLLGENDAPLGVDKVFDNVQVPEKGIVLLHLRAVE